MPDNFYSYQHKRLAILLGWGTANTVGGIAGTVASWGNKFWRQFWLQTLSWGAIDALIALAGRRSASKKLDGTQLTVSKDIKSFRRILLVNVFLDVGYVLSGEYFRRRGRKSGKPEPQGMGAGFQVQGLYLFFYDLFLFLEVTRRWARRD